MQACVPERRAGDICLLVSSATWLETKKEFFPVMSVSRTVSLHINLRLSDVHDFPENKIQMSCTLGNKSKFLTKGIYTRLSWDRSELGGSTGSWGVRLLRHWSPWFHAWSTRLLPLEDQIRREVLENQEGKEAKRNKPRMNSVINGRSLELNI